MFTEQFDQIKPREHNLLASEPIAQTVFETRVGGHVYDRGQNGSVCRWARVLAFEPPRRFVISWDISPTWQIPRGCYRSNHRARQTAPNSAFSAAYSVLEVTFMPEGPNRTRVELEHRHLERHGEAWRAVCDGVRDQGGWPLYLQRYVDALAA